MKRMMALLGMMLILLTACGGESAQVEIDVQAAADQLAQSELFGEDIFAIDTSVIATMYPDLPEGTTAAVYASSGALSDEVAVFKALDEAGAEAIEEQAEQRMDDREESYSDYMPDEADKLENAVVERSGVYVVVVVCGDSDAAKEQVDALFQ